MYVAVCTHLHGWHAGVIPAADARRVNEPRELALGQHSVDEVQPAKGRKKAQAARLRSETFIVQV